MKIINIWIISLVLAATGLIISSYDCPLFITGMFIVVLAAFIFIKLIAEETIKEARK